jgi:DNA-binding transcriptional regulator YiaG
MTKQEDIRLSEMVKNLRDKLGLTQEQFAAKVGVTWSTVNRWENDRGMPSPLALQHVREVAQEAGDECSKMLDQLLRKRIRG